MREFLEDYGEFIAISLVVIPAIVMFYRIGVMIGHINFIGG